MLSPAIKNIIAQLIDTQMRKHKVPGLFLTIAGRGKILFCGSYGLRDLDTGAPMDTDTLIYIASATKAFTALSCAILVEQKKLAWDRPLAQYIPSFETADPYITENATIIDLLSHRTGIPEFPSLGQEGMSRADLFADLKNIASTKAFRTAWQYSNSLYGIAGHIVELLSRKPWEAFVEEFIFAPLGMTHSDFAFVFDWPHDNRSKLYTMRDGETALFAPQKSETNHFDACGPAGSINSNARDMGKWLLFLLDGGERLLSRENFAMMVAPHCITDMEPETGKENFSTACYGLGWVNQWYKGRHIVWHNGSFGSFVSFMPDAQIGVAVVPNIDSHLGRDLSYEIYDLILGNA